MARVLIFLALLSALLGASLGAECHGKPDPAAMPNNKPIQSAPPKFVKSVKNGKLYSVGDGEDAIALVHVWGSAYEMGYAHGQLMHDKASGFVVGVWKYLEEQVEEAINGTVNFFPDWFLEDVANVGLDAALDLEYYATEPYSGSYFLEEMRGLADATGLPLEKIRRIHMIGELTKGQCSMFGANASATEGGTLLQLRALDWDVDGPFKNFPQITVYHPSSSGGGHAFANVGWTGWIGSITGISSTQMAISEIGVSFPDSTFGKESRFGIPFTYILRDILQFDATLQDALKRMTNAHRTCNLILGVGDGKIGEFRGVEYSASVANYFTYDNLQPTADWHPKIQDVVYWGMDWLCPGYSEVLAKQLTKYHGMLNATITIHDVVSVVQTGDLHIAVYDLANEILYVANARADYETGPAKAYDRAFVQLDMKSVFAEKAPNNYNNDLA